MKHSSDSYCYLWISGFIGSADSVSHALGLSCEVHSKPLSRDGIPLDSKLRNHLEVLEAHHAQLIEISTEAEAGINCVGYYYGEHPGFHLDEALLQQVAKLGLSLDFDLYNYSERDAV